MTWSGLHFRWSPLLAISYFLLSAVTLIRVTFSEFIQWLWTNSKKNKPKRNPCQDTSELHCWQLSTKKKILKLEKMIPYIERKSNENSSGFLIRNNKGQKKVALSLFFKCWTKRTVIQNPKPSGNIIFKLDFIKIKNFCSRKVPVESMKR